MPPPMGLDDVAARASQRGERCRRNLERILADYCGQLGLAACLDHAAVQFGGTSKRQIDRPLCGEQTFRDLERGTTAVLQHNYPPSAQRGCAVSWSEFRFSFGFNPRGAEPFLQLRQSARRMPAPQRLQ